jgi:hypothetical protein
LQPHLNGSWHRFRAPQRGPYAKSFDSMLEAGGVTHAPASDEGALMLTILHGPLHGFQRATRDQANIDNATNWLIGFV